MSVLGDISERAAGGLLGYTEITWSAMYLHGIGPLLLDVARIE
jgi:hypothetical protein